ncbi:hypothetical protein RhiirA4_483726 [Rhizophagus irregularis]|uniref:Uncharacterized protein n=1 Tax=Rhizophagus irregularis TaxID=588596 RepID=A0A2I1HMX9_9GLOM|nr:hypothetical protein RhiirA4_483726 [Rhizophagus irregularis]
MGRRALNQPSLAVHTGGSEAFKADSLAIHTGGSEALKADSDTTKGLESEIILARNAFSFDQYRGLTLTNLDGIPVVPIVPIRCTSEGKVWRLLPPTIFTFSRVGHYSSQIARFSFI